MVQLVGDHDILFAEQRGAQPLVRVPAARVREGAFAAHQMGEGLFQLTVDGERPANEAHRPRAGAEPVEGALAGRDHLGDVAEAEVVVRGQDHDLATPFHLNAAVLGGGEHGLGGPRLIAPRPSAASGAEGEGEGREPAGAVHALRIARPGGALLTTPDHRSMAC